MLPPGEGNANQAGGAGGAGGTHPFLVGLGQTFPGLPFPPHLPYYLDPNLLQQLRAAPGAPPANDAPSVTPRPEPVSTTSRGTSPVVFPPDEDEEVAAASAPVTMVTSGVGTSEGPMRCTVSSQTSPSPVLELLRLYSQEEGTQTSDAEDERPGKGRGDRQPNRVEVGIQLTPPVLDSDSDSNCPLTMPHLTARTIDCGTQAGDGTDTVYSSSHIRMSSSNCYYDSDRRSASPPPPALVAEGSPRHKPDTSAPPPYLTDQEQYVSDSDNYSFRPEVTLSSSLASSCHTTPTHSAQRGKGIFDLDIEFLNRQILEASDGLELLSTLAEHAQREQQEKKTSNNDQDQSQEDTDDVDEGSTDPKPIPVMSTDTEEERETDINKNYNAPKASMFMDGPSMYSFSSKFGSPTKKDSRLSSSFSYTGMKPCPSY